MRMPVLMAALLAAGAWAASPADAQQGSTDQGKSGAEGGADMPASSHQQQLLKPMKDKAAAGAQQGSPDQGVSGAAGAGVAAEGGVQGECPAGQVTSVGGGCAPGESNPTGTTTGAEGGADMPTSPHQQQLLKPMKDKATDGSSPP